ncbi:hypothetical protein Mgra_00001907 [Meloidogyne graminicola]|uniref:Uncharacterized protein n=1 Tax=Meloidogyne graminicola TaxID=189291 RepID=A0A8T0A077_9BILA|nr:hypothetical protein Mgra_00001907 [Meloidogyne graminicola]
MVNTHRRPYFSIKNDRKLANFEHFYQEEAEQRTQSYRKASRPLVPENKTELAKWEPRVMSPEGIVDIARQCIEVTDAFIHLDNYLDQNKQYNSSNLEHLRQQLRQKNSLKDVHPSSYIELIAQCEANPGKFPGTFYCLQLVLGKKQLSEYIRNKGWTEQQLREWNITNDLLSFNKEMDNINATETNSSSIVLNNNEKQENEVESSGGIEFYTY